MSFIACSQISPSRLQTGICHADMGDAPARKEGFLTQKGPVYELIDKDELAGLHVFAKAAAGRHREDISHRAFRA